MCGIAGITQGFKKTEIAGALSCIRHRGPDDSGVYEDESVSMGMVRLAIIDLSSLGHQPMQSHCGRYWIVYNGECYNFQEVRQKLEDEGEKFKSNSDTEVVLAAYVRYGPNCLSRLNGMFAFAIWDTQEKKLFAARDRLGIKPFYYAVVDGKFVFASEIKAMLSLPLVDYKLCELAIFQYFTFGHIQQPLTIIKGVMSLMPGHFLTWQQGELITKEYWKIGNDTMQNISYQDAVDGLLDHLKRSVKMQMISDRPLGLFLSGGLDSSAILALMHLNELDTHTFSIGFAENADAKNESNESEMLARYFGVSHTCIPLSGEEVIQQLPNYFEALDQPSTDGLNTYLVSKYASSSITVALCGLGPDEIFGGYSRHALIPWKNEHNSTYKDILSRMIPDMINLFPKGIEDLLLKSKSYMSKRNLLFQYTQSRTIETPGGVFDLLQPGVTRNIGVSDSSAYHNTFSGIDSSSDKDVLRRILRLDVASFMSSQLLRDMDAVSMKSSMEVRFPLVDHQLVEYGFSLPSKYKLRKDRMVRPRKEGTESYVMSGTKRLLLDAVSPLLPKDFGLRSKNGFKLPINLWLRLQKPEALHAMVFDIQKDWEDYLHPASVQKIFDQFPGGFRSTHIFWNVLTFIHVISNLKKVSSR